MSKVLTLAQELIRRRSLTPDDAGCQALLATRLATLGFAARHLRFADVDNVWLTHGAGDPVLAFVGHTDVVPTGPLTEWMIPPFAAEVKDGYLYGRGAADMKGSVAAFVTAVEQFMMAVPNHAGTIALLLTSDEEGAAVNGTCKVVDYLQSKGVQIKWCLVGEPSSQSILGDTIKHGRRGSLEGQLTVQGVQGHVAYPELAVNPLHCLAPALSELCQKQWDADLGDAQLGDGATGDGAFPPTSFQISNVHAGTGTTNVIPGTAEVLFNFRFSPILSKETLIAATEAILDRHGCSYQVGWRLSGEPFLSAPGELLEALRTALHESLGYAPSLSTGGGTSDGRFVAPTGAEVMELGPVNATIHQVDECVRVADLDLLTRVYGSVLRQLFGAEGGREDDGD